MTSSFSTQGFDDTSLKGMEKFQLLSTDMKLGNAEDTLYEGQVSEVLRWWGEPRFEGIKRPYSADDIVSKRGSLQQIYPSSLMAKKLFNLIKEKAATGQPVHTSALHQSKKY